METMKPSNAIKIILAIVAFSVALHAQASRYDNQVTTVSAQCVQGSLCPQLVVPGATIQVCTNSSGACSPATTYTDVTGGTACPSNAQVTIVGGANPTQCVSTVNLQGQFGFWALPGVYYYYVTLPAAAGGGTYAGRPMNGDCAASPAAFIPRAAVIWTVGSASNSGIAIPATAPGRPPRIAP